MSNPLESQAASTGWRSDYQIGLDEGRKEQATRIDELEAQLSDLDKLKLDIENALKAITEYDQENTDLKAQLAAAWIPVRQRLPVEGESVFVFSKYGQSDLADFIGGAFENCWSIDDADETITHWIGKPPYPPIDKAIVGGAT